MGGKIKLILMSTLMSLLVTGMIGLSVADDPPRGRKEPFNFESISLKKIDNFTICDDYLNRLRATALNGRIYALCGSTDRIRVFDSVTYARLDDLVVKSSEGFAHILISSCDNTNSLFIIDRNFDKGLEILKINVVDKSQSIWLTRTDPQIETFSISPIDCHLVILTWKINDDNKNVNSILIYDQEKNLIRTVQVPIEIQFPSTVLETTSGTYLLADTSEVDTPYVIDNLDQNGQVLKTLRRDDADNYDKTFSNSDPSYFVQDSQGFIYAPRSPGDILIFDPSISRDRVLIPSSATDLASRVFYDAYTDRLLVYAMFGLDVSVYAISGQATGGD